nr:hypothetical protein [Tanacetum cinerariifolium]
VQQHALEECKGVSEITLLIHACEEKYSQVSCQRFNAIHKRCSHLGKSGENEMDVMRRAKMTFKDEFKGRAFTQEADVHFNEKWVVPDKYRYSGPENPSGTITALTRSSEGGSRGFGLENPSAGFFHWKEIASWAVHFLWWLEDPYMYGLSPSVTGGYVSLGGSSLLRWLEGMRSSLAKPTVRYVVLRHRTKFVHGMVSSLMYDLLLWKEGSEDLDPIFDLDLAKTKTIL